LKSKNTSEPTIDTLYPCQAEPTGTRRSAEIAFGYEAPMPDLLHLVAFDSEDLEVISANLQDAVARVADMAYLPRTRQFAAIVSRFDWIAAVERGNVCKAWERCRTGLHFERVFKVSSCGFTSRDTSAVLNLLSISFQETQSPGGVVELVFSAGRTLRLEVECLEAELCDLGLRWKATALPEHPLDDEIADG
jgi:hypothetical protein